MFLHGPVLRALAGRPVLVFGSAPEPVLPPRDALERSCLVCVNGAAGTAAALGLPPPEIILAIDALFIAKRPTNIEAINALRGLHAAHLVVVSSRIGRSRVARTAAEIGLTYDRLHVFSRTFQRYVVARAARDLGYFRRARTRDTRVSTGIFACALALHAGAASCTTAGISFAKAGHSYSRRGEARAHVEGDRWFVERMRELGRPFDMLGRD